MMDFINYHIKLINNYIIRYNYKSYLEIGIDEGVCFSQISCDYKIGIDPYSKSICVTHKMTSNEFFIKDIENSLKFLNDGGTIIVHDCLPKTELEQIIPRQTKVWTGDVWKAWLEYRKRNDLRMFVFDVDYGIGIIQRGSQNPIFINNEDLTWENFEKNKEVWLNLTSYA